MHLQITHLKTGNYLEFYDYLWFRISNDKGVLGCFYDLLACGPLESSTVDVVADLPPSIAVTCAPSSFGIAYRARIVGFLVVHGEQDVASVTDGHKSQSPQDESNWYNIKNLQLHACVVRK